MGRDGASERDEIRWLALGRGAALEADADETASAKPTPSFASVTSPSHPSARSRSRPRSVRALPPIYPRLTIRLRPATNSDTFDASALAVLHPLSSSTRLRR
ncbi:hypothetical protein SCP_0800850 [Sparassis crispa]|uniref:Uncharacterized protein n=1 Tax=Sparassis crispa TaxID=139825 RepID=A0A401GTL7_9APHY|nr:hypothetical protein SCP_0800850 [Sparassis crispa]GBE85568.1 hypothetical protein SCP_0800850 [Sparassis crispa]